MNVLTEEAKAILEGTHHDPHQWLGMHPAAGGQIVRAYVPEAVACHCVELVDRRRYPLMPIDERGIFESFVPQKTEKFAYRIQAEWNGGARHEFYDPYAFLPTISEHDLYLFNEGTDRQVYQKLGAHCRTIDGISGVSFAVWAPSAKRVSVVGDFNHWDGRRHMMRSMGSSGVWELFCPELNPGAYYKFELLDLQGNLQLKADPYGFVFEPPPHNASVVQASVDYEWGDELWLKRRSRTDWLAEPVSIYEVHLGSWKRVPEQGDRPLNYREFAEQLVAYLRAQHYTHVEFMPLAEFPFEGSWGYQVTGFFAPTYRYGTPDDFRYLVDLLHQHGFGVILDWVPAHFPKDDFALANFDGTNLYEHADPRQGEHQDWGTLIFNYGRPEVRTFLIGSALAWCDHFHIDGLRVDAVASMLYLDYSREHGQWIPNQYGGRENIEAIEFLREANDAIHQAFPGVLTIAEESTAWGGVTRPTAENGLGFDLKWNMGWMHDALGYFQKAPLYRKWHQNDLTFGAIYQNTEHFNMVFSHDEVVHGKGSMLLKMGAEHISDKAQHLRALYGWMWGWPGKKTLFMGSDFGQSAEWNHDRSLDWHLIQYDDHCGIQKLVADLNKFYGRHPALGCNDFDPGTFRWINHANHEDSILSFMRLDPTGRRTLVVVGNFNTMTWEHYRLGVPQSGIWKEVINTGAARYGGWNHWFDQERNAEPIPWDDQLVSINIHLPAMSTLFFELKQE